MQNRIPYFRWTAGLIVVTNSFLTGTKNDKYGSDFISGQRVHYLKPHSAFGWWNADSVLQLRKPSKNRHSFMIEGVSITQAAF